MFYFFYYIPVGLNARLRRFSVLTWAYAGICVAVFLLNRYLEYIVPMSMWSTFDFYRMIYVPGGSPLTAFTAAFLHFGWLHLVGNLVYLVFFGRYVEDRLGRSTYAFLLLSAAGIGNYIQGVFNTEVLGDPGLGIIGASGAVSGLLGAFSIRFFRSKMKIAYWAFMPLQAYTRAGKVEMPAILAIVVWFGLQAVRSLVQLGGASAHVAHVTHISGFLWGMALAVAAGQFGKGAVEATLAEGDRYLKRGEPYAAQGAYLRYLTREPNDGAAYAALARAMVLSQNHDGARKNYVKACELLLAAQQRGAAEDTFREALRGFPNFTLAAEAQLNLAFGLERNLKPRLATAAYVNFADRYPTHPEAPFALLRAAGLQRQAEPGEADELYARILDDYPDYEWVDFAREERLALARSA